MLGEKNLLNFLRSLTSFSEESYALLQPALEERELKKNDFLLRQGDSEGNKIGLHSEL